MTSSNNSNGQSFWTTLPGIITAIAGLLTAVATLLGVMYTAGVFSPGNEDGQSRSAMEQEIVNVLDQQYQNINQGDYEDAYALFADRSQQIISLAEYEAWFKAHPGYSLDPYDFLDVDVQSDDRAVVEAKITPDSAESEPQTFVVNQTLIREDGQWRVVMRDDQIENLQGDRTSGTS